ncbi:hypothetical protein DL98DRAFT_598630 [Cadophora sp. DSE1049]|nr:hypothetical protein DL98DRAFT_598630 [Cadophora sp. DSE1049]
MKLGSDIVTFKVGASNETRTFKIHKDILCEKAPHFDTLFNGPFLEGQTQVAVLDEDDPDAFELFVSWVYQSEIEMTNMTDKQAFELFIDLFAFAEKYNLTTLADHTMDFFLKKFAAEHWVVGHEGLVRGYRKTHAKSKLRLFLARTYVYVTLTFEDHETKTGWAKKDIRAAIVESEDLCCDYHQHGEDESCPYKPTSTKKEAKKARDARIFKEHQAVEANLRASIVKLRNMFPELSILTAHNLLVANKGELNKAADQYVEERQEASHSLIIPSKRKR